VGYRGREPEKGRRESEEEHPGDDERPAPTRSERRPIGMEKTRSMAA
jgi:hypothetical protein